MTHAENNIRDTSFADLCKGIHTYSLDKGFWPFSDTLEPNEVSSKSYGQLYALINGNTVLDEKNNTAIHNVEAFKYAKRNLGEALMLVNTELAEALEGFRKGVPIDHPEEGAGVEIADAVIRLLDLGYGILGDTFVNLLLDKQAKNLGRPPKHGKNF